MSRARRMIISALVTLAAIGGLSGGGAWWHGASGRAPASTPAPGAGGAAAITASPAQGGHGDEESELGDLGVVDDGPDEEAEIAG